MNWRRFLDRLIDDDEAPKLPPISDEEARAFADALTRPEPATAAEPRRAPIEHVYGESFDDWIKRTARCYSRPEEDDRG